MKYRIPNIRCDYCGRFISYQDLDTGKAQHHETRPDTPFGPEEYDSHHIACKKKSELKYKRVLESRNRTRLFVTKNR